MRALEASSSLISNIKIGYYYIVYIAKPNTLTIFCLLAIARFLNDLIVDYRPVRFKYSPLHTFLAIN